MLGLHMNIHIRVKAGQNKKKRLCLKLGTREARASCDVCVCAVK